MKTTIIFFVTLSIMMSAAVVYATFSSPVPVQIDTNYKVAAPSISTDDLTLFYYQDIGGQYDIYYSTRIDRNSSFNAPIPLTILNTDQMEVGPDISSDGLSLYFARGDEWENDIFICTINAG